MSKIDLSGQKFYKLTVLEKIGNRVGSNPRNIKSLYRCLCDCGKEVIRRADSLKPDVKCSCGCYLSSPRKDPKEMGISVVMATYKENSKTKNLLFELTREEFSDLILANCFYCNSEPSSISRNRKGHAKVIYNGIDRLNNSIGYTKVNSVSCCRDCNYLKNSRNYDEFINKVSLIYNHHIKKVAL